MDKSAVIFLVVGVLLVGTLLILQAPVESIPPTNAFQIINMTNGNVTALTYNSIVTFLNGSGIIITPDYSLGTITFTSSSTGGGGENNTASNLSPGTGLFYQKSGVDLEFKSLAAGNNISISSNDTSVTITAAGSIGEANTMSSPTHAETLILAKSGVDLPIKGIACGGSITCASNSTDVTLSFTETPGGGFDTIASSPQSTATILADNSTISNTATIKTLTQGQGITLTNGSNAVTIATNFKLDTTTCTNQFVSAIDNSTGDVTCTTATASGGAVSLGADVPCTQVSPNYCTVFTIPLTASSGNAIEITLVGDSATAGVAIQPRVIFDNAGNTGYCTFRTYTTATVEVLDVLAITTTTADTGETTWLAGANVPMPLNISCGLEGDATPGNAVVQIQNEGAATTTIQKGSFYLKTP